MEDITKLPDSLIPENSVGTGKPWNDKLKNIIRGPTLTMIESLKFISTLFMKRDV